MNIVKAHIILEKFTSDSDPIKDMRVGIPYLIKDWFLIELNVAESSFNKYVTINDDYTINLNFPVTFKNVIKNKRKYEFPEYIQFNDTKEFDVSELNLTTLRGCPKIVHGKFECDDNKLASLDFCPEFVEGDFICKNNFKDFSKEEIRNVCKVGGNIIN